MVSTDLLRVFQLLVVILGSIVVYFGSRAYSRTRSKSMFLLVTGFIFITIGAVASGVLFELMKYDLTMVQTVQAGSQVMGFLLIVYSIVGTKD